GLFANVHELQIRALGELAEERCFLRARDNHFAIAERRLERGRVLAAKLLVDHQRLARFQRRGERLGVDPYRAITAADFKCLACQAHLALLPPRLFRWPSPPRPARRRLSSLPR